jgi:hypothetical protein
VGLVLVWPSPIVKILTYYIQILCSDVSYIVITLAYYINHLLIIYHEEAVILGKSFGMMEEDHE